MILDVNKKDISKVGSVEKINASNYIVKYLNNLGEVSYVSIISNSISDDDIDKLYEIINNPDDLFSLQDKRGQVFRGYVQKSSVNSLSCLEFNKRLLEYLNRLYKYVELLRYNIYSSSNGKLSEKGMRHLNELDELEKQSKSILESNSELISPIWRGESTDIKYGGTSLADIYYNIDHSDKKRDAERIMEYCLASGITELHGLYDYGAYGGPISYSFICQLFGEKAAEAYRKNSAECKKEFEMMEELHNKSK